MIASIVTSKHPRAGRHRRPRVRAGGIRRLPARVLLTTLAGASLAAALAAGSASAATAPAPAPGVAPGAALVGSTRMVFYTAGDRSVWMKNLSTGAYTPAGGQLVSAPQAMADGASVFVFGQGTDGQLWVNSCNLFGSCGSWLSLGGDITSKPAAVFYGPSPADYSVYARGSDGSLWGRNHTTAGWGGWYDIGGNLLAGTGPAASFIDGTYVLVVGTNHELYIEGPGVTGFNPAGGSTTSTPALTALPAAQGQPAALVGFARGTDNAGYYHRFLSTSPGWHSMGGSLTSGLAAFTQIEATIPMTYTFGLGTDNQIYDNAGTWAANLSAFSGWHLAS